MPDGKSVSFPDEMPKEQIKSLISSKFPQVGGSQPATSGAQTQPVKPPSIAQTPPPITQAGPQQPGLMQRIGQDVQDRFKTGSDIMTKPGQNPLSIGLQMAGKVVAGTAGDIVGEVGKSAYGALPEGIKEKVSGGLQKAAASPLGQAAIEAAKRGGLEYANWAKDHPEAAANVESLVDIASFIPAGKVAGAVGKVAGEATLLNPVAKGIISPSERKLASITKSMHDKATSTIESAKNNGINYHPDTINKVINDLGGISQLKTAGDKINVPKTVDTINELTKSLGTDSSLRNLVGFSQKLGQIAHGSGPDAAAALSARKIIDKAVQDGTIVSGDAKNVKKVQEFKKQWGTYKLHEQVSEALQEESTSKIKSKLRKIVDSDYFNSLSPDVQRLIKTGAKGKVSGNILQAVGSLKNILGTKVHSTLPLLEAGGAIAAGHPAVAAGIGGVLAASGASKQIARGTVADILKAIQEGK